MSETNDSPRMGRVLQLAMEEILGAEGSRSLLRAAEIPGGANEAALIGDGSLSTAALHRIFASLEQQYGELAGRGIAQRIGRACFRYGLREYGDALGFTSTSFRLRPFSSKLKTFAGKLADMFNGMSGRCVRVEEGNGKLQWHMARCPFCEGEQPEHGVCLLPVGLAEEAMYWLSSGKTFGVEEIACVARGDPACILQVDKTPLS